MILARMIFHAKFGRAAEVVALMKETQPPASEMPKGARLLTDLAGRFDTVVLEYEAENLAEFERRRAEMFANPEFQKRAPRMAELIEWGESEFYTIE